MVSRKKLNFCEEWRIIPNFPKGKYYFLNVYTYEKNMTEQKSEVKK